MRIQAVNSFNYNPNFGVNLQSSKLKFEPRDVHVRIKGYEHNSAWARKIIETIDNAAKFIREVFNFEAALKQVTEGVREANELSIENSKRKHTGILRISKEGWRYGSDWSIGATLKTSYTKQDNCRYKTYADRLDNVVKYPLKNPYQEFSLSRPRHDRDYGKIIIHGNANCINSALKLVNDIYSDLYGKYILKEAKKEDLTDINNKVAEIRWILAHATPWERGSDAISNTFMRSIYKAMGIKTSPLEKGVSLDMEAFCTNLEDYKKNFPSYFTRKPKVVDSGN